MRGGAKRVGEEMEGRGDRKEGSEENREGSE